MKVSKIVLTAGVALAIAAPVAGARELTTEHSYVPLRAATVAKEVVTEHSYLPLKVGKGSKAAKPTNAKGLTKSQSATRPPLYIHVPGFTGVAASDPDPIQQCENDAVNCTDQQFCQFWGENCAPAYDATGAALYAIASNTSATAG
jgi:hypothetical protein